MTHTAISAIAVLCLLAAFTASALLANGRQDSRAIFICAATMAGTLYWAWAHTWGVGLSTALLASILATQVAFGLLLIFSSRDLLRLGGLIGPYLLLAAFFAAWLGHAHSEPPLSGEVSNWLLLHIALSVLGYGFLTVGATASLAVLLRERALKRRTRSDFLDKLPSIAAAERIELRGLACAEIILGVGILFGMAAELTTSGEFLQLTHKALFSFLAFLLIGVVLFLQLKTGLAGRLAARLGLTAYLLVSLGYPGVKFVSSVLLAP